MIKQIKLEYESKPLIRNEGSSVQLNCGIGVYPLNLTSYFQWYFVAKGQSKQTLIRENVDYVTLEDSFIKYSYLNLKNLARKDTGIYICRNEKSDEVNELKVDLNVHGNHYDLAL